MNDNQILEVHSRWVYNFMGILLEAQASFISSHLCILFKNYSQILVILKPYTLRRNWHDTALDANECVWWIDSFIANLGHPLCGCPVNAEFSISNEERQNSSFHFFFFFFPKCFFFFFFFFLKWASSMWLCCTPMAQVLHAPPNNGFSAFWKQTILDSVPFGNKRKIVIHIFQSSKKKKNRKPE